MWVCDGLLCVWVRVCALVPVCAFVCLCLSHIKCSIGGINVELKCMRFSFSLNYLSFRLKHIVEKFRDEALARAKDSVQKQIAEDG